MTEPVYAPFVTDFINAGHIQGENRIELEFRTQDGGLYRLPISYTALTKLSEVLPVLMQSPDFPSQSKPSERH
jgi:hypothetical protein